MGSKVCDVGTDHGYLPAFLYNTGKYAGVCATDIKEKPLETARKNLIAAGADGVELYLCDGLQKITRDMADTVIIAGMGGEVISGIIDRCAFLRDGSVTLILQPTTSADKLRRYLAENGFEAVVERAVSENGKVYAVMKARFCGAAYNIDGVRSVIGLITPDYDDGLKYVKKQYAILKKRADDLQNTGKNTDVFLSSRDTANRLKELIEREEAYGV